MSIKSYYNLLLYNDWANKRLLADISQLPNNIYYANQPIPLKSIHLTLAHMHYHEAKHMGFASCKEKQWERHELVNRLTNNSQAWLDSKRLISDNTTLIMQHNTYHRGQLHSLLSTLGYEAATLDIFYFQSTQLHR